MERATDYLVKYGIRPSMQRIAVMKYLLDHRTHPTVDDIYMALSKEMPTLSKTTVYNTLELLVEHKAVLELTIDGAMAHYDGYPEAHSHFLCRGCKKIFDTMFSQDAIKSIMPGNGFEVEETQLYYKGLCPECKEKMKSN